MFPVITSPDNDKLKTIGSSSRSAGGRSSGCSAPRGRTWSSLGREPEFILRAGEDVEPELLDAVSTLGSGTRVIGVYKQRWAEPRGDVLVYLHGVEDPGNVGAIIRSAHALANATVVLGPGCADPYSPKAVRASMGSIFERPPATCNARELDGHKIALDATAESPSRDMDVTRPVVLVMGSERGDLPEGGAAEGVRIPVHADSLNVAMAATVALYEVAHRMAADG